jgi:hypothetical protein
MLRENGAPSNPGPLHLLERSVAAGSSAFADDDNGQAILTIPVEKIDGYPAKKSKSQPLSAWVTRSA